MDLSAEFSLTLYVLKNKSTKEFTRKEFIFKLESIRTAFLEILKMEFLRFGVMTQFETEELVIKESGFENGMKLDNYKIY